MIAYFAIIAVPLTVILSKIVTFIFTTILSSYYGASYISDVFLMANALPTILFDGLVAAIITCYIPVYQKVELNRNNEKYTNFNSTMVNALFIVGALLYVIFYFYSDLVIELYASGFNIDSKKLLIEQSRVMLLCIPFILVSGILRGYLQLSNCKAISNLQQIVIYLVLSIVLIGSYPNFMILPYGFLIGAIISFFVLLYSAYNKGFRVKSVLNIHDDNLKELLILLFPIALSTVVGEINSLADRYFSSFLSEGVITSMTLSYKLSFSIQGIISTALMIVIFPNLSKSYITSNYANFGYILFMANKIIAWIVFPVISLCLVLNNEIISLLFGHGSFSSKSVETTSILFVIYLLGVAPMCFKNICDKAFFAIGKTNLALKASLVSVVLNIFFNYLVYLKFQQIGLAIVTVIVILFSAIMQWSLLYIENKSILKKDHIKVLIKPLLSSCALFIILGVFKYVLLENLKCSDIFISLYCIIFFILLYISLSTLFYKDDVLSILNFAKSIR